MTPLRFKIILSSSKDTICVREGELKEVLLAISKGQLVITREGIFNPSFLVAIVPDEDRMKALAEAENLHYKYEEPSPFAKLLSEKMKMLSPEKRTEAQEEAAAKERKEKSSAKREMERSKGVGEINSKSKED